MGPRLEGLLEVPGARVINFEPSLTLALDESCRLQCRLSIETRTNAYQVRTGEFADDQISVYFTVRQYWGIGPGSDLPRLVPPPARDRRGDGPGAWSSRGSSGRWPRRSRRDRPAIRDHAPTEHVDPWLD